MEIRKATSLDFEQVWNIFSEVIKTGDSYVFAPDTPKSDLNKHWFADNMTTFVAVDNEKVLGTYIIKANQIDLGNHIANCSYMVSPDAQGKGIGKKLCEHSLKYAKECGYEAVQFNIVVSTNIGAVELWKNFGFKIIGTTPKAFRHQQLGYVNTYIMYKDLE